MTHYLATALLVGAALISHLPGARATETTAKFHGNLIVIECSINAGTKQTVKFNAVGIHRIDGVRYKQTVPFKVYCINYAGGKMPSMTLKLEGDPSSFDKAAVATDVAGLGIQLQLNNVAQPLNEVVSFDYNSVPVLSAVPVLKPGTELDVGQFNATLKLVVEVA